MTSNGSEEKEKLVFKQRKKRRFLSFFFDSNHKNKIIVPRPTHIETKATKKQVNALSKFFSFAFLLDKYTNKTTKNIMNENAKERVFSLIHIE
ncbi:hypothetical protein [Streptococcus gallolyticus]|uniref:hypothetical protein n=1 Tax=Streptococcus gallolyticus TaxID=315405 RepID=UPI0022839E27|nr:hypothetical protein [Streptococcus gallolyticus]MCY7187285.1 hypothetical protein [Streptococcus gallolyticus subsp. gallolyticus]